LDGGVVAFQGKRGVALGDQPHVFLPG
jgi:hypothetical protein